MRLGKSWNRSIAHCTLDHCPSGLVSRIFGYHVAIDGRMLFSQYFSLELHWNATLDSKQFSQAVLFEDTSSFVPKWILSQASPHVRS